jgi:hypothetical protein
MSGKAGFPPYIGLVRGPVGISAPAPFTAMQHTCRIPSNALEVGHRMVMIAARSCGATALAGNPR